MEGYLLCVGGPAAGKIAPWQSAGTLVDGERYVRERIADCLEVYRWAGIDRREAVLALVQAYIQEAERKGDQDD